MRRPPLRALPAALALIACHGSTDPVGPGSDAAVDAEVSAVSPAPPSSTQQGAGRADDPDFRAPRDAGVGPDFDAGADPQRDPDAAPSGDADAQLPNDGRVLDGGGHDGGLLDGGLADTGPRGDGGCVSTPASTLDVLFMVDDSGSMAEEQAKLAAKLTRLVQVLATGDKEAGKVAPRADDYPGRRFPPPSSVRFGVVSSNLGTPPGVANPAGAQYCGGQGGDGLLVGSGAIAATDQIDQATKAVVVPARPECAAVSLAPAYVGFGAGERHAGTSSAERAQGLSEFSCIAATGTGGCGIEQSLESAYKALAPSSLSDFVGPSTHGQGERNGFLRPESLLAVVMVSDEDDCSLPPAGTIMFENGDVGGYSVGVRCQMLAEQPQYAANIQPTQRYVDGLLGLRAGHPERVVFGGIVGLPQAGVDYGNFDALLARADMQAQLLPGDASSLQPVCGVPLADGGVSPGTAYPGRRFVRVAKGLAAGGAGVVLRSICDDDYAPVIDLLVDKIAAGLTGC